MAFYKISCVILWTFIEVTVFYKRLMWRELICHIRKMESLFSVFVFNVRLESMTGTNDSEKAMESRNFLVRIDKKTGLMVWNAKQAG